MKMPVKQTLMCCEACVIHSSAYCTYIFQRKLELECRYDEERTKHESERRRLESEKTQLETRTQQLNKLSMR